MARSLRPRQLAPALSLVAVLLASMVVVSPASASTAQLVELPTFCKPVLPGDPCGPSDTALVYQAGGEANRVTVEGVGGGIRISDSGAAIEPGQGCSRVDEHSVSCSQPTPSYAAPSIFVATGAGADRVRVTAGFSAAQGASALGVGADGGPGNDLLVGGPGPDQLFGGAGADRLRGRGGDDLLHDASRRDFLPNAEPVDPAVPPGLLSPGRARDSYDGGAGDDTINFEGRLANLRINLGDTRALAGARGEHDLIGRVENAVGGAGADRIAGNRLANQLQGGEGNDLLVGRAGDDGLKGQAGRDVLRAGPGNDALNQEPPIEASGGDRMSCGAGSDRVGTALPRDFVNDDCEQTGLVATQAKVNDSLGLLLPLRRGQPPRVLGGSLECYLELQCQVRLELRVRGPASRRGTAPPRGTLLGSQTFTARGPVPASGFAGDHPSVDVRLSSDGVRLLRRHRALRVRVILATQYSGAEPDGYVTLLRAPQR